LYEIREAREDDRYQSVELLIKVFKEVGNFEEEWVESWKKYMNRPENEDWNYIATFDGKVVANLAFFANCHNSIRGTPLRFGGVWAVVTDSAHRRKGILRRVFEKTFSHMKEKEITLSILEPSPYYAAQLAYERIGYATAERRVKHEFHPSILRPYSTNSGITQRIVQDKSEVDKIVNLEKSMSRFGSKVFTWSGFLNMGIDAGNFYLLENESGPVGCVNLSFQSTDEGKVMHVMNAYYKSNIAFPEILSIISNNSSDVVRVTWECDTQVPLREHSQNIRKVTTTEIGAMMMRVVDFEGFCNSIESPESSDAGLTITLEDKLCPWNEGTYALVLNNGTLDVARVNDGQKSDITLNPHQLSSVVSGLIPPSMLNELGRISCSSQTADLLDLVFPLDSFNSYFRF